ncbi:PLP-dependent aminotransferase family protein [Streptomyces sp. NPDC005438]|uniref:MocR-like pyridoxine biosynthesis transcription factor PdxR n=1 Tax=Streptomyces sp. NPDC005438 TaxID=3156880 RepID=UPI0033B50824
MAETRATSPSEGTPVSGGDLHLELGGSRRRGQLTEALRAAIRSGRLTPGTRLPSSRALAADLGLARNTVADAYGELVAEGWLVARQGSGTRVAPRAAPPPAPRGRAPRADRPAPVPLSLVPGRPDPSAFPRTAWASSVRRALATAPAEAFGFPDPRGRPELRRALADYLARARGVRAHPDRLLVCSGNAQALAVLGRALRGTVAVEEYVLPAQLGVLQRAGLSTRWLPVDQHGARVGELGLYGGREVAAVLLTAAHQHPTGGPLSPDRRAAVVEWAARTGGLVLEDDYDGEFRFDGQQVGALQGLDPERVVYLGTASKALSPALRLGWMVLPERWVEPVARVRQGVEWQLSVVDQLTLADFLERGAYDRQVRTTRQRYRTRRDRLVSVLAERAPGVRVTGLAAGLHSLVELPHAGEELTPPAVRERAVVRRAARIGLDVRGLASYRHPSAPDRGRAALVVGYGGIGEHDYPAALDLLCRALAEAGECGARHGG